MTRRFGTTFAVVLALTVLLTAAPVYGQGILGAVAGKGTPTVFPSPDVGLPTPAQSDVTGLPPSGSSSHGVAYFGSDNALVSAFGVSTVFNIEISSATNLATISTSPCNASGTIAVAPNLQAALMMGGNSTLCAIRAPFVTGATIDSLTLPGVIQGYQTEAIVFNSAGRAFVYTTTDIAVLDPPYDTVAFTIPVSGNSSGGSIAITPDGNQLLVTKLVGNSVDIFTGPFTPASTPVTLAVPGGSRLDGIKVAPDGTRALVVDAGSSNVFSIAAPFSDTSSVETIPVPTAGTHEDIDISADSQLAVAAGNGGGNANTAFIEAPFTAAGATVHYVQVSGGRGNGAFRFLPPGLAAGLTVSKTAPATVSSGSNLTYTINYANTGSEAAAGVILRDTVPAGTSFVSASDGGTEAGGVVSWAIGTLAAGASGSVTMTVLVTAGSGTVDNNAFSIEADGILPIFGPPVSTDIVGGPVAILTISKTAPATVASGGSLTYTIDYSNDGTGDALAVVITDTVPAGTTFVSATDGGTEAGGVVTWNIGTVAAGASGSVSFTVTVDAAPDSTVVNDTYSIAGEGLPAVVGSPVTTAVGAAGPTAIPTLGTIGVVALLLLITGAGVTLLRRVA
jgi:uncharacterized repeat protein (TIGR01451 family)